MLLAESDTGEEIDTQTRKETRSAARKADEDARRAARNADEEARREARKADEEARKAARKADEEARKASRHADEKKRHDEASVSVDGEDASTEVALTASRTAQPAVLMFVVSLAATGALIAIRARRSYLQEAEDEETGYHLQV